MKMLKHLFTLVIALIASTLCAMATTLQGTVTDETGEPLPGVSVLLVNQKSGTITDLDGHFSLNSNEAKDQISFSYVGFQTRIEQVGNNTVFNVKLKEDSKSISEVVVIGYGQTSRKEITGSIASVKSEYFNQGSYTDAMGLLQGKVAGLSITNPNGADPQSSFQILLRGTNTLTSGQGPLVIIDGVAGTDIKNVNFQDVESIDVLKDGSAAAIYGTRGSNGVIIITTKRAKEGKTSIEYQGLMSIQTNPRTIESLTASEFRSAINTYMPSRVNSIYDGDTDWFKEVTRPTPFSHKHSLAIAGGTKDFSHRTTINIDQNQGLLKDNNANKFLAKTNLKQTALKGWLTIDYNAFYSMRRYTPANYDIFYQSFMHNPTEKVYDPLNEVSGGYTRINAIGYYNPVAMLNEEIANGATDDFGGNARASLNVLALPGLKWDNFLSYELSRYESERYRTRYYPSAIGRDGIATISSGSSYNMQYESTLNYANNFGKHAVQALLGYTYQELGSKSSYMQNSNFDTDRFLTNNIGVGASLKEGKAEMSSYREMSKLVSFFGRVMYNYDEKYLFSASLRREGSSRFGVNNKWGWFPAASFGWRMNEEAFLKNVEWVNELKLRLGFGATGNQDFANYKSLTMMGTAGKFFYDGEWINTYQPVSNPNPDLRWEKKYEYNLGVDFSFLNDRIGGSVDAYYRQSTDLLYNYSVSVPPYLYTEIFANVGTISNKGIEVTLYGKPVMTKNFTWSTFVTASHNQNKLIKFTNDEFTNGTYKTGWLEGDIAVYCQRMEEGKSLGTFYGPVWQGVDEFGNDKLKGQLPDGRVPESKWEAIGNAYPAVNLGWTNTFNYKKWDLSFSLRASIGGNVLNKYRLYYENFNTIGVKNIMSTQLENPSFIGDTKYSSKYIEDASYLKLDNISLGYNFIFQNDYIRSIRLYATAQNLFCLTAYKGLDPEVNLSGLEPGIESLSFYPRTTSVTFGVNVNF